MEKENIKQELLKMYSDSEERYYGYYAPEFLCGKQEEEEEEQKIQARIECFKKLLNKI